MSVNNALFTHIWSGNFHLQKVIKNIQVMEKPKKGLGEINYLGDLTTLWASRCSLYL